MSPSDSDGKKNIRQRAGEFLEYGVLGCCPDAKSALGRTIADANAPKQPEKVLPGIENIEGRRFDPKGKYAEGMELNLFPSPASQRSIHGQPNFGWLPKDNRTDEQIHEDYIQETKKRLAGPRVVQEVWEVDDDGNPKKLVSSTDDQDDEEQNREVEGKGLGRTLRELNPGNTLIARAAKKFGVWIDDLGKFRCPPGTPQANQFTDEFGSTCFAVSARQIVGSAQQGLASLNNWWKRRQYRNMGWEIDEFGNVVENVDILEGRQEYRRVFTGARSRVRAREVELKQSVEDLLRLHKIEPTPGSNEDIYELLRKLNPNAEFKPYNYDSYWNALSVEEKRKLQAEGVTRETVLRAERGFLYQLAELAITNPERFQKTQIKVKPGLREGEAYTLPILPNGANTKFSEVQYGIEYDPFALARNVYADLPIVEKNQRLGLRVVGAASDEEAADAMHKFVVNENMYAGGMVASMAKDPFFVKGAFTAGHELAHTIQIDKLMKVLSEKKGADGKIADVPNLDLARALISIGDGIDLKDLGLVASDFEKVAFLGGQYGADVYYEKGDQNELWKIEASVEMYALREWGVIEGDDVDAALAWMDGVGAVRGVKYREASKRKNLKRLEAQLAKPQTRPDGRLDHPDSPPPPRPRRARPVRNAEGADRIGQKMRKDALDKLETHEKKAVERLGDPRSRSIASLINPDESLEAILSIDSGHKLARKHGVDLDEVDVSGSKAVSRVAYDPKRKRLYVTYKGREGETDRTYYYRDVEPETVLELHKAEAKGTAINSIKKTHALGGRVEKIPEKIDRTSLDSADIASQVQFNLIPTLTALEKSEVGREMRVVISVGKDAGGGELVHMKGITTARIYHDEMSLKDGEIVLSIPADGRGIPVEAGEFDREKTGSMSLLMIPPMRVAIIDDKGGRRAELFEQESADTTLNRMLDEWPSGSGATDGRIVNSARNKVEEIVASHLAMGEGDGKLADGSTTPISARRIRTRNADVHSRQKAKGGSPTKPTKAYRDSLPPQRGFASMGKVETQQERKMDRVAINSGIINSLRSDASVDPEIRRLISDVNDKRIIDAVEASATGFHEGVDRRPRLRVSPDELDKVIADGGRMYSDRGHMSLVEKNYQMLMGIHPDTDDIDRPVSAYVVHPAQDALARNALRRSGRQIGDSPIEWPSGSNPHGDVDADGEIEIILKPEVSGRTAYGFGYGIDNATRPVWMNSDDSSDIADALIHVDSTADVDGSRTRILNALSAFIDGDYGSFTDVQSVKPAATSQNERTTDFINRSIQHSKQAKPQRLGAQIMGGFVNEEISEIRYPWSSISASASNIDVSDVVEREPISDRLRRLGFTDAEIEYFYKVNGERSLDYISSGTMSSLREYRKAMEIKKQYESKGIPSVSFAHPSGMNPLDVSSYTQNPDIDQTVEDALAKAINAEVDALLEKMLKQVRKTRGKIWEMNPKIGAPA